MPNQVPILSYHAVDAQRSVLSVSPEVFAMQMSSLHEHGYCVIPLSKLVEQLRNGNPLPKQSVVITFDDGFESMYTAAFPVLAQYGFTATVFLVPDYSGKSNDWPSQPPTAPRFPLLNWSQVSELDRHGIEFGAHTLSHPRLDRLDPDEAEREILGSKTLIDQHLGRSTNLFAYPYGVSSGVAEDIVRHAYAGACTTRLKLVGKDSDPFAMERIDAYYVQNPIMFRALSSSLFSLYLGLRRPIRSVASAVLKRTYS